VNPQLANITGCNLDSVGVRTEKTIFGDELMDGDELSDGLTYLYTISYAYLGTFGSGSIKKQNWKLFTGIFIGIF
jgi:hypothetical protein